MVIVSEIFLVNPRLTLLWATFWILRVWSIASMTSFLRIADRCLASLERDMAWETSGVLAPTGLPCGVPGCSAFDFSTLILYWDLANADETVWHIKSITLLRSVATAFSLFLALSSTCSCFCTDLSFDSKIPFSFKSWSFSSSSKSSAPSVFYK